MKLVLNGKFDEINLEEMNKANGGCLECSLLGTAGSFAIAFSPIIGIATNPVIGLDVAAGGFSLLTKSIHFHDEEEE